MKLVLLTNPDAYTLSPKPHKTNKTLSMDDSDKTLRLKENFEYGRKENEKVNGVYLIQNK